MFFILFRFFLIDVKHYQLVAPTFAANVGSYTQGRATRLAAAPFSSLSSKYYLIFQSKCYLFKMLWGGMGWKALLQAFGFKRWLVWACKCALQRRDGWADTYFAKLMICASAYFFVFSINHGLALNYLFLSD
jgi:hypothetical protein